MQRFQLVVLSLFVMLALGAQNKLGSLRGSVVDSSGAEVAVCAGADGRATDPSRGNAELAYTDTAELTELSRKIRPTFH